MKDEINQVTLMMALTSSRSDRPELWTQLEGHFLSNLETISRENHPIPYDVLAIYASHFAKMSLGQKEFWNQIEGMCKKIQTENTELSLNASINFGYASLARKLSVDIWPQISQILKAHTDIDEVTQVIDLELAFLNLVLLQESQRPDKLELMKAIGEKIGRD
jgi:hypothetical protein